MSPLGRGLLLTSIPLFPTVSALWGKKGAADTAPAPASDLAALLNQADDLLDQNEIVKLYDLLIQNKDETNDEIMWRLARAATEKGKISSDAEKKALYYEAFEYAKKAIALNDKNFACHKWYAILLDYTAEYEGTKQRILNAFTVKEHFQKAIDLNPKDTSSIYALGYWCFLFADMGWVTRKVASAIFASPPTSTYEEALSFFEKAEEIDPNFYCMNLMMIGKTHLRMKNKEKAAEFLKRARDYPVKTADDKQSHKEAVDLLKGLGIKE